MLQIHMVLIICMPLDLYYEFPIYKALIQKRCSKVVNSRGVVGSETDPYYTVLSFLNSVIHHA